MTHRPLRALELLFTATTLAVLLAAPPATAKDERPGDAPSSTAERAESLFRQGRELSAAGRLAEAFVAYREAFELDARFDIAGNLGRTELALGHHRDAAEHLTFSLEHMPKDATNEQRERVLALVREARQHVGALRVTVNVEGADVTVDGRAVGKAPLSAELFVETGARVVSARSADGRTAEVRVVAIAGATTAVDLALGPGHTLGAGPTPPPPNTGPAAKDASGGGPTTLVYALAGGALVAIGAGATFTVLSEMASADADAQVQPGGPSACLDPQRAGPCGELRGALEDRDLYGNAALIAFSVGGALVAGTVLAVVLDDDSPAPRGKVSLQPVVGSWSGLAAQGAF